MSWALAVLPQHQNKINTALRMEQLHRAHTWTWLCFCALSWAALSSWNISYLVWYRASFQVKLDSLQETSLMFVSQVQVGPVQCYAELIWLSALLRRAQAEPMYPRSDLQPSAILLPPHQNCVSLHLGKWLKKQPFFLIFKLKYLPTRNMFKLWWVWDRPSSELQVNCYLSDAALYYNFKVETDSSWYRQQALLYSHSILSTALGNY